MRGSSPKRSGGRTPRDYGARNVVAPTGIELITRGPGRSRPLPTMLILCGIPPRHFPSNAAQYRPFPPAPLENVRQIAYASDTFP